MLGSAAWPTVSGNKGTNKGGIFLFFGNNFKLTLSEGRDYFVALLNNDFELLPLTCDVSQRSPLTL